ncbi:MAG: fused isobutyryl-CoA mutase/GTPase IcmF [Oligoflexales bacterium]
MDASQLSVEVIEYYKSYELQHPVRMITATSLFDGHDASINIMRRLLQARGAEIIHLGHNRSAAEVVHAALQEDVQGIALSSYQGGHMEYFLYVRQLLDEAGASGVKIFGGGGGVITLEEVATLEAKGVTAIYGPEAGQILGLEGMIGHLLSHVDFLHPLTENLSLARSLTLLENKEYSYEQLQEKRLPKKEIPILGITGTGGAGKSSLVDEILQRMIVDFEDIHIGVLCVDPSKRQTGGALLGDRIRMNTCSHPHIYMRSMASRAQGQSLTPHAIQAVQLMMSENYDFIILETSGIGQGESSIADHTDFSLYVMTPEYGASTQLEKIDMLDFADFIAVNKYERPQGPDAVRDVQTTLRRNRYQGHPPKSWPVYGTIASRFNDDGTNALYLAILEKLNSFRKKTLKPKFQRPASRCSQARDALIPPARQHYLSQIAESIEHYHQSVDTTVQVVKKWDAWNILKNEAAGAESHIHQLSESIPTQLLKQIETWDDLVDAYQQDVQSYTVRGKKVEVEANFETLSHQKYPRVAPPEKINAPDLARFIMEENLPGYFPYTGGIFPYRRRGEEPKRQFAGEGGPDATNRRFHFLCKEEPSHRMSTAFDSVTLYGSDPMKQPDIYGKIGESGVSIATLDDMKRLFQGFDLTAPSTSVSMTINGPAPILLALFFNTAIDQEVEKFKEQHKKNPSQKEYEEIYAHTLKNVRGTVQADILKEDQAQNTCIFSTEFSLKLMGDVQEYFIQNSIKNYYAVSISGYHIAEAGANPITQLAFTLANGFTYVEYYLSRGFHIDDFASNLSFFFSNGVDTEYAVLGRVARRIWAIAMRDVYGANESSCRFKYHVQTSGRSLHAQEMAFNDIRTTLQAEMALLDNCNSLHTNAYDEAVTTPTEESVRRAMAIQLIINREYGLNSCENVNQGSYFIQKLTRQVEAAVLSEFHAISARGGVLSAMESQYQRNKIQEESLYYEGKKHSGELPLIGVNTFLNPEDPGRPDVPLSRTSYEEKDQRLEDLKSFHKIHHSESDVALEKLAHKAQEGGNLFDELMKTVRVCSLGQITECLYKVGGQYRRAM